MSDRTWNVTGADTTGTMTPRGGADRQTMSEGGLVGGLSTQPSRGMSTQTSLQQQQGEQQQEEDGVPGAAGAGAADDDAHDTHDTHDMHDMHDNSPRGVHNNAAQYVGDATRLETADEVTIRIHEADGKATTMPLQPAESVVVGMCGWFLN